MAKENVVIIGAGAAGLMAALTLSRDGYKVTVIEAENRVGGRIFTLHNDSFKMPIELGAEFIHGDLPVTINLLEEAGIPYEETGGSFWNAQRGQLKQGFASIPDMKLLEEKLKALQEDMSIDNFLERHFSEDKYTMLSSFVRSFSQGYDAADTSRASTFSFRSEWLKDDEESQYRIQDGYGKLIDYLAKKCKDIGCNIVLSKAVTEIKWSKNSVEVITEDENSYNAEKVIVTIPVGLLQAPAGTEGALTFTPPIPEKMKAIEAIGFGAVIKLVLQFKTSFWKEQKMVDRFGENIKYLGFLVSDSPIPTWWTQMPDDVPVLTGWLGGPKAKELNSYYDEDILHLAFNSLGHIFGIKVETLKEELEASYIINWANEPFSLGGYSYATVEGVKYQKNINAPIENTIFFAGEGFHTDAEIGTVEAALASGLNTAKEILSSHN
ncbi:MAG TPA: NAD(P)/FAD-dependent oxidoreductase [Bacteroidia bacterium]|nr:NAD(P)/FAD-dependent oxidoreductase [Bacteroidia bacterium]